MKKKFVDVWKKYFPVILDYGLSTGNKNIDDILDTVELTDLSM